MKYGSNIPPERERKESVSHILESELMSTQTVVVCPDKQDEDCVSN